MNAITKPDLILETVEEIKTVIEPATPVASTLFARFVAYMDAWTQSSYDSWEKSGRPEREF
jgi:hypothetical protein